MTDLSAQAIEKLVALGSLGAPAIDHPQGGQALLVPHGFDLERLPPLDPVLTHIKQIVAFEERASFSAYVNDYKREDCRIFAHLATGTISAIVDYHTPEEPHHCAHRAIYVVPYSEPWKRWTEIDGKLMPQRNFAEFIEENIGDVYEPDGATLMEIASSLQTTRKLDFQSGINLGNGTTQFSYTETDSPRAGKQSLTVPQKLLIAIPVYYGELPQAVSCFFRYRVEDGQLKFMVRIHQREATKQEAFRAIAEQIGTETGLPVLFGAPKLDPR